MSKAVNIKIKEIKYDNKSFGHTKLHLNFSGDNVDYVLMNTIRRILLENMPIYAFDPKYIKIDKNTSVYDNDYIKMRISSFPVISKVSIDSIDKLDHLEKIAYSLTSMSNNEVEEFIDNMNELNIYIDKKNTTNETIDVTTNDALYYLNGEEITNPYKSEMIICKLNKGQEIKFTAISKLGIGLMNDIWNSVSVCAYEQINDHEYILKIESSGQIDEYELLSRVCKILKNKITKIGKYLESYEFKKKMHGTLILENENNTMGNFITNKLQYHPNIQFAGYRMEHLLIDKVIIKYESDGGKPLNEIFKDVIERRLKEMDEILKQLK